MLGSPYSLTRSDIGNEKGITLLDLKDGKEIYFENIYSPKFIKINFNTVLNMSSSSVNDHFRNNFIDVLIRSNYITKAPLSLFLEMIEEYRSIDFHPYNNQTEEEVLQGKFGSLNGEAFDLLKFTHEYIKGLPYAEDTKDKLYKSIKKLKQVTEDRINNVYDHEDKEDQI